MRSGGIDENTVFLLADTQIKLESFVEDLNNILNVGEVPNIFPADELADVFEKVRNDAKDAGIPEGNAGLMYKFFVSRIKKRLHVCLAFSPLGEVMRKRFMDFPSLVNCTTINWFTEWPNDALINVANKFLATVDLQDDIKQSCVNVCQYFHSNCREVALKFRQELKRIL